MRISDCQAFRRFLDESAEHLALPAVQIAGAFSFLLPVT